MYLCNVCVFVCVCVFVFVISVALDVAFCVGVIDRVCENEDVNFGCV